MASRIKLIVDNVVTGQKSARQYVDEALANAEAATKYNALISTTAKRARQRADEIDRNIKAGESAGKLAGVPFVVKDNFLAFGAPTTAGSKMLQNFQAPVQATAVERLESEGAICIGKANLDAFAHGGSTENSAFGVTKNAVDDSRVSGGSSGGSAVITALDVVPFALGTDTGGSIRQPASFNGVFGIKPTYGAISRYGVVAMASSTDVIGCFTKSATDAALVTNVMAGRDSRDMTTLDDFMTMPESIDRKLRIGLISEAMSEELEPAVKQATDNYLAGLKSDGHTVESVSLPMLEHTLAMYYIIVPAEISSNLARYDGIRYGYRADSVKTLSDLYGKSRDQGFMTENKRRIMIGSYVLSSGFFDAFYNQAQRARTLLIRQFDELFSDYDVLIAPTVANTAFEIGQKAYDPLKMYMSDKLTVPANLAGLPAISVPGGTDERGLPIGIQLIGPMRSDKLLFEVAISRQGDD